MSKQKNNAHNSSCNKSSLQWFDKAQVCILDQVIQQNNGKPFTIQENETAHEQMKLLSTSADTKGIKFSSIALHYQYYHSKFKKRALLMYNVLSGLWRVEIVNLLRKKQEYQEKIILDKFNKLIIEQRDRKKKMELNSSEFSELMTYSLILSSTTTKTNELLKIEKKQQDSDEEEDQYLILDNENDTSKLQSNNSIVSSNSRREYTNEKIDLKMRYLRVASIGGGPGNDSVAFVVLRENLLSKIFEKGIEISCDLYDLEKNWKLYLPCLQQLTKESMTLDFNRCDVTKGLENSLNRSLKDMVHQYDIFLFSYVCNETSQLTKQSDGIFFRELFSNAKPHSMFIFTDVIEHAKKALLYVESIAKSLTVSNTTTTTNNGGSGSGGGSGENNFISFHPQSNQAQVMVIIKVK